MAKKPLKSDGEIKRPVGRPDHYESWMCDKAIQLMKHGASKTEVAAACDMSDLNQLNRYIENYPEFNSAIKKGLLLAEAWWQRKGRRNIGNKDFNSTLWYMNMKNRYGWQDKQPEVTQKTPHEQYMQDLNQLG